VAAIVWNLTSGAATSVSGIAWMNSLMCEVAKCMSVKLVGESQRHPRRGGGSSVDGAEDGLFSRSCVQPWRGWLLR
jgi:hypothetical protein